MKKLERVSLLAVLLAVALGASAVAAGTSATVSLRSAGDLGKVLVDSKGRTLYLFEKDHGGKSRCNAACEKTWPPLTTGSGKATAGAGVKSSLLKTAKRSDNTTQVVYAGHPLYRYSVDKKAGDARGEGSKAFGAEWYALSASGKKIDKS